MGVFWGVTRPTKLLELSLYELHFTPIFLEDEMFKGTLSAGESR